MKILHFIALLSFCVCASSRGTGAESSLVASDSHSDRIWIVWRVSRSDEGLIFVRGSLEASTRNLKGLFSDSIGYVQLDTMDGSLVGLTGASEKIPAMPVRSIRLYGPEGLHEIPKNTHHGPVPLSVACSILRQPLLDWIHAHPAVVRVRAEFRSPTFEVGARIEETSRPLILTADLVVSADRSSLTVDIPEIRIEFPPLDIIEKEEPNQAPEPTPMSVTAPASAGAAPATGVAHL